MDRVACAMLAGVIAVGTAIHYMRVFRDTTGDYVLLRGYSWGTGLLVSAVLGGALALVGFLALAPLWRVPLLSGCLGVAASLLAVRLGEVTRLTTVTAIPRWLDLDTVLFAAPVVLLCAVLVRRHRSSEPWIPRLALLVIAGAAIAWGAGHLIPPYSVDGRWYGEPGITGVSWVLGVAVVVGLTVVASRLEWVPASPCSAGSPSCRSSTWPSISSGGCRGSRERR